ncbi:MAG: M14 family metallopeptidase [Gemmatimonadota bacterium]|nr:M14 family metallopeptidase [Gemmatimonadota bacterium]
MNRPLPNPAPTAALALSLASILAFAVGCAARIDPSRPVYPMPETRAEASGYAQTSTYGDVTAFINGLRSRNAPIGFGVMGYTSGGRAIPYLIASRPVVTTPAEARALGRPIVYVNANIHAGEVEGKEALLALVRDLAYQRRPNVLDSLVLIAVPIYNADGNEKFADQTVNRTEQNGPARVGQRANGQGLDLNRDYVKAEAPETRASLAMFDRWDPDVYVDLHTTDGSYHGFALTYAPSLNPVSYAPGFPGDLTRDVFLPEIRSRLDGRGIAVFDYGNFDSVYEERDITATTKRGWYTYDHTPRYGTNYYGMRGRVSILSEAYSHDPFRKRVASTYAFVQQVLSTSARHSAELLKARSASENVAESDVAIRSRLTTKPFDAAIPFEVLAHTGDSARTQPGLPKGIQRTGRFMTQLMPVYDRFEPSLEVRKPDAYLVPNEPKIVALLKLHELAVTPFAAHDGFTHASSFTVDSVTRATREFQGHHETRVTGRWGAPGGTPVPETGHDNYIVVSAEGRFGPLATYLLEPESDDGLVDWNFLDDRLASGVSFPILRLYRH